MEAKEETLRTLGGMVKEATAVLKRGDDLRPFGNLLHEAWMLKRSLGDKTSNGYIEESTRRREGRELLEGNCSEPAAEASCNCLWTRSGKRSPGEAGRLIYVPFKFESTGS